MNYIDRETLKNLSTAEMLKRMDFFEAEAVEITARTVQATLATLPKDEQPTLSNISIANLAYFFEVRSYAPIPMLFRPAFTSALCRQLEKEGYAERSKELQASIKVVSSLCAPEELRLMQYRSDLIRQSERPFDFRCISYDTA